MDDSADTATDILPSEANDFHAAGPASSIQAIDKSSVHRICSGQVVLTLATAVKELVENSLDAGATTIDVRLKEYGSELLEVVDNGCGVESSNFVGLTLKHHTSKLRDFGDLVNVETFGFRGEALSSLCALSNLVIVTCHKDATVGTRLEYDHNGKITSKTPCARQCGTTVSLGQLFHTLPVRHKEFQRNLKREFSKMVHVLSAYCIMSTGVKMTCTNQTSKGKKTTILTTNGNDTIKENITNIFGPKQGLIRFIQVRPSEQVSQEYGMKPREDQVFKIEGYVSSSEHGHGRAATDRQFFFINRRPCDLNKVSRVVNEVYHMYNRHQNPFVVLDISLNKDCVDVNVTPDKRQIFLAEEKLLLATLKTSLIEMFDPISSVYQVNQGQSKVTSASLKSLFTRNPSDQEIRSPTVMKRSNSAPQQSPKTPLTVTLASLKRSFSSAFSKDDCSSSPQKNETRNGKQKRIDNFMRKNPREMEPIGVDDGQCDSQPSTDSCLPASPQSISSHWSDSTGDNSKLLSPHSVQSESGDRNEQCSQVADSQSHSMGEWLEDTSSQISKSANHVGSHCLNMDLQERTGGHKVNMEILTDKLSVESAEHFKEAAATPVRKDKVVLDTDCRETEPPIDKIAERQQPVLDGSYAELDTAEPVQRKSKTVHFSMERLRSQLRNKQSKRDIHRDRSRNFRAQIAPTDNQAAEEELRKEIRKDMFEKMEILGQFNLGFIIAKLGTDLFIIDQHATDEKYNFEMLQKHTVLQSQKLIQPQCLELTAVNESVLVDNIDIFQTNGFDFLIDEDAPPTQRVKLTSMPVSRNWTFGKDDIEELIFMLTDSPGVLCRPSRVRMMFASRSCRKSIMVGTALNKTEMKKLICHMGEIEQPWNCPHGRPTMRHLIDLDCLPD